MGDVQGANELEACPVMRNYAEREEAFLSGVCVCGCAVLDRTTMSEGTRRRNSCRRRCKSRLMVATTAAASLAPRGAQPSQAEPSQASSFLRNAARLRRPWLPQSTRRATFFPFPSCIPSFLPFTRRLGQPRRKTRFGRPRKEARRPRLPVLELLTTTLTSRALLCFTCGGAPPEGHAGVLHPI